VKTKELYQLGITLASKIGKKIKLPQFEMSDKLRKGFADIIELREGLKLIINEYKPKQEIEIAFKVDKPPLEFAFCLSGEAFAEIKTKRSSYNLNFTKGNSIIFYLPNSNGKIKISNQETLKIISLHISPDFLRTFMDEDFSGIPFKLVDIILGKSENDVLIENKMTPQIKIVLKHIYENNYTGTSRKMFLEGKALELMTLQMSTFIENLNKPEIQIKDEDIKKVELARQIIEEDYISPPTLSELTSKLKISHTKLNFLFKKIFDMTVFEFIRNKRIEYSLKLLLESDISISEISYEAGWSNPGHFTREFKKIYDISPKTYREKVIGKNQPKIFSIKK